MVVLSFSLLVDDDVDDEEEEFPVDGSSSPAVSVVCRCGGEDESNVVGADESNDGSCSDACDLWIDCCAGPSLLSIAELISSLRKRLKSPLINSLNSNLLLSILSSILLIEV